ncbi:MAG: RtcB family protein [Kouleothrix sp.]|nr:RtcB family protein [Kouleothrix sp.]
MMELRNGIAVFGDVEAGAFEQIERCRNFSPLVRRAALMGDNHKGYSCPIGGVLALTEAVSPSSVGYDIACGIKAVQTNLHLNDLGGFDTLADQLAKTLAFGVGRTSGANVDHPLFDDPLWTEKELAPLKHLAAQQLGTIGSGNHFVDLLSDEAGAVWIMAHFGSRGFGHKVASGFLNLAAGRGFADKAPGENMEAPPTIIPLQSDLGQLYWKAMTLAGRYAYAGRDYVVGQVLDLLEAHAQYSVHNHHNFTWKETHDGESLYVVRKGATPAFPGQLGAVGGSMGDKAVIVEGVDTPEAAAALHSTIHGAGRVMSRTAAAGKVKWLPDPITGKKRPQRVSAGAVSPEMMRAWLDEQGVVLRGGGLDESPHVYKRLPDVLAAHAGSIKVLHRLQPFIVVMAGADVFDPYKD